MASAFYNRASQVVLGKASAANEGDVGLIPGSGRSPGEGNGKPLQYSFLENPMDRGAWHAIARRVIVGHIFTTEHECTSILQHV